MSLGRRGAWGEREYGAEGSLGRKAYPDTPSSTCTLKLRHFSARREASTLFSSVRDRVEKANGMTVIQAIELSIYTLRTLRNDESAGYIALVRTSDRIPDSDPSVRDVRT